MASSSVIGVLKALLTADTAQFDAAMGKAAATSEKTAQSINHVGDEVAKLTPQAERMAKAFAGDKLLYSANSMVQAVGKIGGATKLTTAEQAKVNAKLTEALSKYKALGIEAPAALRQLHKETTTQTSLLSKLTTALGPMGTALVGAFSATAVIGAGKKLLDFADNLKNLEARTGMSTTALQKFQLAFDPVGVSIDTVAKGSAKLAVNLVSGGKKVTDLLTDLGLSAKQLKTLSLDEQLFKVGDAVGNIKNQSEKLTAARTLFGPAGIELLQGLNGHLEETTKQFEAMGLILDEETITAADDFGDALGLMGKQLLAILGKAIGPMLPALGMLAKGFMWVASVAGEILGLALKGVTKIILGVTAAILDLFANILDLAQRIPFVGKQLGFLAGSAEWLHKKAAGAANMLLELDKGADDAGKGAKKATGPVIGLGEAVETTAKSTDDWLKQFPSLAAAMENVRQQIAGLTDAQRAEIQSGLDLGVSTSDIAKKMGLAAPVIDLYASALKNADKFAQDLAKTNREVSASLKEHFLEQASKNLEAYTAQLGKIQDITQDTAKTIQQIEFKRAEFEIEQAKRAGASWQEVYAMERALSRAKTDAAIADLKREFEARTALLKARIANEPKGGSVILDQKQLDAETAAYEAAVRAMEQDFEQGEAEKIQALKKTHDTWTRAYDSMRQAGEDTIEAVSDGLGSMLVGAQKFKDGFIGIWHSIQSSIAKILGDILNDFIHRFIGGLISSMTGAQSSLTGGVAGIGGLGSKALGAVGLLGGGGTGAAAGVAGVESAIGGGAAAGGGALGAIGAFATNPITLAVAGGIAAAIGIKKLLNNEGAKANDVRDQDLAQFADLDTTHDNNPPGFYGLDAFLTQNGRHDLFDAFVKAKKSDDVRRLWQPIADLAASQGRPVRSFAMGGFVPPGAVVPAILHGGSFGEDIKPRAQAGPSAAVHLTLNVNAIDAKGVADFVSSPAFGHSLSRAVQLNTNGLLTSHRRALVGY